MDRDAKLDKAREWVVDALAVALGNSTHPKVRDAWRSPDWHPDAYFQTYLGKTSKTNLTSDQSRAIAYVTKQALDEHGAGGDLDADTLLRLYCGALVTVMFDGPARPPGRPNKLLAAAILLGFAPQEFYSALESGTDAKFEPLDKTREEIRQWLVRLGEERAAAPRPPRTSGVQAEEARQGGPTSDRADLAHRFKPGAFDWKAVNDRRALVQLMIQPDIGHWNWGTGRGRPKPRIREIAEELARATETLLRSRERATHLITQLPDSTIDRAPVVLTPRAEPHGRDLLGASYRTPPSTGPGRGALRAASAWIRTPSVAAVAIATAVIAAVTAFMVTGQGADSPPSTSPAETKAAEPIGTDPIDYTTPLLGSLRVRNLTGIYDDGFTGWLSDVVVNDRVKLRLRLRNPTDTTLNDVAFQLQAVRSEQTDAALTERRIEQLEVRVDAPGLGFIIPLDEEPPDDGEDGAGFGNPAEVLFETPDNEWDHCSTSAEFVPDPQIESRSTEHPGIVFYDESGDLPAAEGTVRPVFRDYVGEMAPGEVVTYTLKGTLQFPTSDPGQLDGGQALEVAVNDRDWTTLDAAAIGDTVTALVRLHNGACSTTEAPQAVRLRTETSRRGVLTVSATGADAGVDLGTSRINLIGSKKARLEPILGTTRLYGYAIKDAGTPSARCTKDQKVLERLPEGILQAGIQVMIQGYIPREPCHAHTKWVMTDFRVAPR